jgi:CDP-diacylglycerol--serine O-phosphatidyltransferase
MRLFSIPNILTLINLFFGCVALVFAFSFNLAFVPYCTFISLVADFFDGFSARAFKTNSELGKQLDSLADVVSFGVVPAVVVFQLLWQYYESTNTTEWRQLIFSAPALLIALFAALRLAKFNIDTRQSDGFIGLATPAATIFVVGVLLIFLGNSYQLSEVIFKPVFLYSITIALCYLMISEIPMFSFKFKRYGWKGNELRYLFLIAAIALLAVLNVVAIPVIIILYILFSLLKPIIKL